MGVSQPFDRTDTARLVLQYRSDSGPSSRSAALDRVQAKLHKSLRLEGMVVVTVPAARASEALSVLRSSDSVEWAEFDRRSYPSVVTPNDPWYTNWQPSLKIMGCPTAWEYTVGDPNLKIAVLDTGVDLSHPDLAGNVIAGYNAVNGGSNVQDTYGHGTGVAGTTGAVSNNGWGVAAVVWSSKILPVKIADADSAWDSDIADGLAWASDQGARVANISWGPLLSSSIMVAADYFRASGGVVVTAAGNSASNTGLSQNVRLITVSATTSTDTLTAYSSFGQDVDVSAPGSSYTTKLGGTVSGAAGTSIASPHVAGVCALILSANPSLWPEDVERILEQSADDLGDPGWDPYYGWGRVNAGRAVLMALNAQSIDLTLPTVAWESPAFDGVTLSGNAQLQASANDNVGLASVQFYVDGKSIGNTMNLAPFAATIDTTLWSDGSHTLSVVAVDTSGNVKQANRQVTFKNTFDTEAPSITITSPTDGSKLGKQFIVEVNAQDNVGVARVEVYVDGSYAGSSTTAPFSIKPSVKRLSRGWHSVTTVAYDTSGNSGQSATIQVLK